MRRTGWTSAACKPCSHLRLVLLCELSPSFETFAVSRQEHDVERCAIADHEHHPVELSRRRPIVFFQDRGVSDRRHRLRSVIHQLLQTWYRCASVPLEHCAPVSPRVLRTEKSLGFTSKPVSTPTPVACVPRSGAPRASCLIAASSFAACCLLWFSSFCNSVFCLFKPSSAVDCRERGAFQSTRINQLRFQLEGVQASTQAPTTRADSNLEAFRPSRLLHYHDK